MPDTYFFFSVQILNTACAGISSNYQVFHDHKISAQDYEMYSDLYTSIQVSDLQLYTIIQDIQLYTTSEWLVMQLLRRKCQNVRVTHTFVTHAFVTQVNAEFVT